jgi:uncharacterized membrane protein YfcA
MLSFCIAVIIAALAGMGVGGGGMLVIWLSLALDWQPAEAQTLNLLFFIVSATIASFFHRKKRSFDRPLLKNLTLAAIPGALFGAALSSHLSGEGARSVFGWFLLISGAITLLQSILPKKSA